MQFLKATEKKGCWKKTHVEMEKTDLALLHSEEPHNQVMSLLSSLWYTTEIAI